MSKHVICLALAAFAGLASCTPPPPVPPPNFRPNPPYPPVPVRPDGQGDQVPPQPEPQPDPPVITPGNYPTAKRTTNPGEVISPYEPYNVIDISGPPPFKSGQLARDPSNQKIFRVP